MECNRRGFLKGASLAAVAGAATAGNGQDARSPSCNGQDVRCPSEDVDVLVAGGGPAGACAAIAAARNGARVMVVERGNCLGGMATSGLVGPFMTCYDKTGSVQIIRGLFNEIVERLVARGGAIHPKDCRAGTAFTSWIKIGHDHCTPFEPEALKLLLDEMCAEAGVKVLFHADFVKPLMDGTRIAGATLFTKAGFRDVRAKVVVDATGDGDVAFRAGVPTEFGDPQGKRVQPATMFFTVGGVDVSKVDEDIAKNWDNFYRKDGINYRSLHWRVSEAREAGDWPLDRVSIGLFRGVEEDEFSINTSRVMNIDGTKSESLTEGEIAGRQQVRIIFNFLKKYVPGFENSRLILSGSTLGIRETRHIEGIKTLTVDQILNCEVPEDSIMLAANSVDVHGKFGPMSNEYIALEPGVFYGIPYGCLVPQGVKNMLVAGRCLSATSDAAGAVRVMPPCMGMGQAAGVAAAMSAQSRIAPAELDVAALREKLKEQKVYLG
jgi:hypothetical protein